MLKHLKLNKSAPDPRSMEEHGDPLKAKYQMTYVAGNGLVIEEYDTHFSLKSKTKTVCVPLSAAEFWTYEEVERPRPSPKEFWTNEEVGRPRQSPKDSTGSRTPKSPKR